MRVYEEVKQHKWITCLLSLPLPSSIWYPCHMSIVRRIYWYHLCCRIYSNLHWSSAVSWSELTSLLRNVQQSWFVRNTTGTSQIAMPIWMSILLGLSIAAISAGRPINEQSMIGFETMLREWHQLYIELSD